MTEETVSHPDWYVICTNYFDDPFFVNITEVEQNYPVYYSQHGGNWIPTKVADNITTFAAILSKLKELESVEEHSWNTLLKIVTWKMCYGKKYMQNIRKKKMRNKFLNCWLIRKIKAKKNWPSSRTPNLY